MESNWIFPNLWWEEVDEEMASLTASIAATEHEISTINGVMTRSKTIRLKTLKDKLYYDERMLIWYKKTREERIQQTKIIVDQLLDFGFECPPIQFEPFEYTCDEFCRLLEECRHIANDAYDLYMRGFRCTLFY